MALKVGDKVRVKPGKEHDSMTKDKVGEIVEISTPALGIKFEGMKEVHHWYVEAEVEPDKTEKKKKAEGLAPPGAESPRLWLLHDVTARELEAARKNWAPTAADRAAWSKEEAAALADGAPRNLRIAGNEAEIIVCGTLSKRREMFLSYYYSSGYCTYDDIRAALALADADPNVKRIILNIDSPGGYVAGLLETVKAIEATQKPVIARASCALSAAYALAAACDRIEAINEASEFGCLGVAVMYYVDPEHEVTLTNTDSPEKRPDPTTPEGKASIVRYLDATNVWFTEAIARGRTAAGKPVTAAEVNADFGRGATLMAGDARKRGMIDGFVAQRTPASGRSARAESESEPTAPQTPTEAVGQESTMNKKLLAQTLGLAEASSDEAFEAAIVAQGERIRTAEASAKTATDKAETAAKEADARVKATESRLEAIEAKMGAKGDALLGAIDGLLATKAAHEELVAKKAEDDKAAVETKRAALIKQGLDEGKLTPKTAETFKDCPIAQLEGFIANAPRVIPAPVNQPAVKGAKEPKAPASAATLTHEGKAYAELKPSERAALKKSDPDLFHAMRKEAGLE